MNQNNCTYIVYSNPLSRWIWESEYGIYIAFSVFVIFIISFGYILYRSKR